MCNWVPAGVMPEMSVVSQRALLVQITVAEMMGVRLTGLCAPGRGEVKAAFARQVAMYLCKLVYAMSLADIAMAFARDRSTARHAIRRVEEAREHPEFDRTLAWMEAALRRAGGLS